MAFKNKGQILILLGLPIVFLGFLVHNNNYAFDIGTAIFIVGTLVMLIGIVQHVGRFMHPAPLMFSARIDFFQGIPKA